MHKNKGVELTWNGKNKGKDQLPSYSTVKRQAIYPYVTQSSSVDFSEVLNYENKLLNGRIIKGNNLAVMADLLNRGYAKEFGLIYLDPPYFSQSNYTSQIKINGDKNSSLVKRRVFMDSWPSLREYLDYIWAVLKMCHSLLSDNGSLFVHVDWHVGHYIKVLLDEIFSPAHFVNEIIWCYGGGSNAKRHFHRKHDTIFWYSKGENYIFNPVYRPYTEKTKGRGLTKVKGPDYKLNKKGALMHDWWTDINKILSPTAYENLKFPTQKPLALLERIIKAASDEDSIIGDFFAGSGTTAAAAEKLERKWIVCDESNIAISTTYNRLVNNKARPFILETVNYTQEKPLKVSLNKDTKDLWTVTLPFEKERPIFFWEIGIKTTSGFNSLIQMTRKKVNSPDLRRQVTLKNFRQPGPGQFIVKAHDYQGDIHTHVIEFD